VRAASERGRALRSRTGWIIPPSVAFVLIGLGLSTLGAGLTLPVPPRVFLAIALPGLVFEAAFRTRLEVLRPTAAAVLLLAVPGVVLVATIVAAVLSWATGLASGPAFVVGAMVAATDPAAVLATFRRIPVPERLATTVEMESLVNDGTGIVLFGLALDMLAGGGTAGGAVAAFLWSVLGGGAIGAIAGWAAGRLVRQIHDRPTQLTLTVALAYGSYLAADLVGASGVIATLAAATVFGAGARHALPDRAIGGIDRVWDALALVISAAVFVLIGLLISPQALVHALGPIAWGILAVLVARAIVVYGLLGGTSRAVAGVRGRAGDAQPIPAAWLHVLFWAALRGAVSVALALSLPADLPDRDLLQAITFGIVLFTILVQGTTAARVVRRSGAVAQA